VATFTSRLNLRKPASSDHPDPTLDISGNMDLLDAHGHSGTYVPSDPTLAITYNSDSTIASVAETQGGTTITTTFTYNADSTIATSTRLGVTRTYSYVSGNLTAVA